MFTTGMVNVRFGSLADKPSRAKIHRCPLLSESGQNLRRTELTLCAISGLMHRSKQCRYSITSSVSASSCAGTSRPSVLAVLRLITNSNLVDRMTGRSAGFSPLRIRPA